MEFRKDALGCRDPYVILQLMSTGRLRLNARALAEMPQPPSQQATLAKNESPELEPPGH